MTVGQMMEYYPPVFSDMVEFDGFVWFSACNLNGMFRMDCRVGEMEYLGTFPVEGELCLHSAAICYKEKLFFVPECSKKLIEYDPGNRCFHVYEVPYCCNGFFGAGQYGRYLFFWNFENFDVIRFDMESKKFRVLECSFMEEAKKHMASEHDHQNYGILGRDYCILEDHLYVPSPRAGIILDINMGESKVAMHAVSAMGRYITICHDGACFWLSGFENYLVKWNAHSGETDILELDTVIPLGEARLCAYSGGMIYYVMEHGNVIQTLNTSTMEVGQIQDYEPEKIYWTANMCVYRNIMLKAYGGKIWVLDAADAVMQSIENGRRTIYKMCLTRGIRAYITDRIHFYLENRQSEWEIDKSELEKYIIFLYNFSTAGSDRDETSPKTIGSQIYQEISG